MLESLSPHVRGLILDMDGVLWKDTVPIGNLPVIFNHIREHGLKIVLATNNATKTVEEYLEKLRGFGVKLEPWQIVTSAEATAHTLARTFPDGGTAFVIGENGLISALRERRFAPTDNPEDELRPVAVVVGIDRSLSYAKLRRATLHIRAGVPFYGTNADRTFPTPAGLVPGTGSILAALEAATDVSPIVIGKPAPFMLELAVERMKLTKEDVLVVGDRLETDIAGGQAIGARTALVLSGISTRTEAEAWRPTPDIVAQDLTALVEV